jgi:Fe2+ or Zn2+ uptake regulation protein
MHEVERILRKADGPLSLNEIKRRMSAKAVRHRTVRQVINEFRRLGFIAEGSKGIVWTLNLSPKLWTKGRVNRL